ncbi:MAG: molecular chaperone [Spirochaetaceae bacterium]|nr:MAG: molecular chaperone [Spirochaetaceae bacterium]
MALIKRMAPITALLAVILFFPAIPAQALSLEPLTHVFGTSAAGRIHTYRVINTQDREIAVRIRVTTRDHDAQGREFREDASDQWLLFPARMVLAPGQSQSVRVQFNGPGGTERERAFRIIAEQLPVDISGGDQRSGINVLFRYEGSAYVRQGRFAPDIDLVAAERHHEGGIFRGILVRFENRGTTHGILNDLSIRLRLTGEDGTVLEEIFRENDLEILGGRNLLAGRVLEEVLPLPDAWSRGTFDVQYDVQILD